MEAQLASGSGVEQLLDPDDPAWALAGEDPHPLIGTPAGLQHIVGKLLAKAPAPQKVFGT